MGANANKARSMKKALTCSYQSGCLHEKGCEGASLDNIWMIVSATAAVTQRSAMSHLFTAASAPRKENLLMRARRK